MAPGHLLHAKPPQSRISSQLAADSLRRKVNYSRVSFADLQRVQARCKQPNHASNLPAAFRHICALELPCRGRSHSSGVSSSLAVPYSTNNTARPVSSLGLLKLLLAGHWQAATCRCTLLVGWHVGPAWLCCPREARQAYPTCMHTKHRALCSRRGSLVGALATFVGW